MPLLQKTAEPVNTAEPDVLSLIGNVFPEAEGVLRKFLDTGTLEMSNGQTVKYGPGSISGRKDLLQNYARYLSNLEKQPYRDAFTSRILQQYMGLTQSVARMFGESPDAARRSATGFSVPGLMAFGGMMLAGTFKLPTIMAEMMRSTGMESSLLSRDPEVLRRRNLAGSVASSMFDMVSDFRKVPLLQGLSQPEAAKMTSDYFRQGYFNQLLSLPGAVAPNGTLTPYGAQQLRQQLTGLFQAGRQMSQLFGRPKESVQTAIARASEILGADPIQLLGDRNALRSLQDMSSQLALYNVTPEELQQIAGTLSKNLAGTGISPQKLLNLTNYSIRYLSATRGGPSTGVVPAEFNTASLMNLAKADQSRFSQILKGAYGALVEHRGAEEADRIITGLMSRPELDTPAELAGAVNEYLSSDEKITPENIGMYADTDAANQFEAGGRGFTAFMRNRLGKLENSRENALLKSGYSASDVEDIRNMGPGSELSLDKMKRWASGRYALRSEALKRVHGVKQLWSGIAEKAGFSNPTDMDRFMAAKDRMEYQLPDMERMRSWQGILQKNRKPSGITGAIHEAVTSPNPSWTSLGKTLIHGADISNDQLQEMHGEDLPGLEQKIRGTEEPSKLPGALTLLSKAFIQPGFSK